MAGGACSPEILHQYQRPQDMGIIFAECEVFFVHLPVTNMSVFSKMIAKCKQASQQLTSCFNACCAMLHCAYCVVLRCVLSCHVQHSTTPGEQTYDTGLNGRDM